MLQITGNNALDVAIVFVATTLVSFLIGMVLKHFFKKPESAIGGDLNRRT